jgi:L-amino acid N-acyltransferase YncA
MTANVAMPASVAVRPGEPADLPAIKSIYDAYVESSVATFDTEPSRLSAWEQKLPCLYVACGPEVLGFAYAAPYRPRPAYDNTLETTIYLSPAATGRGVGRLLYSTLLDRLDADGVHTALAVIALPNPASVALHEAFGFTHAGVLREVGHKFGEWVDTAFYQRLSAS